MNISHTLLYSLVVRRNRKSFLLFTFFIFIFLIFSLFIAAMMNGYERYIIDRLSILSHHIEISRGNGRLLDNRDIRRITSLLDGSDVIRSIREYSDSQALMKNRGYYTGVSVLGLDVRKHDIDGIEFIEGAPGQGITVGERLAELMELSVGEDVQISNLDQNMYFRVDCIFRTGLYDIDSFYILMSSEGYSEFYILPDKPEKIGLLLDRDADIKLTAGKIRESL
ncbi:MAG: hypothetical protein ACOCWO_04300, partial [Candidatus Muiribacteriaceae bacterium]